MCVYLYRERERELYYIINELILSTEWQSRMIPNNQIGTTADCICSFMLFSSHSAVPTNVAANCQSSMLHRCENLTAVQ